jgi:hypothetical protein
VRLLIDANPSQKVAAALRKVGLESVHVGDVGLLTAPDRGILDYAGANALVIVSADTDFGELLAAARRGNATLDRPPPLRRPARIRSAGSAAGRTRLGSKRPGSRRDRHHCAGPDAPSLPVVPDG